MASRNKQKAEEAIADLKRETGKEAIFLELDLADLRSIKNTVHTFQSYVKVPDHGNFSLSLIIFSQTRAASSHLVQQRESCVHPLH